MSAYVFGMVFKHSRAKGASLTVLLAIADKAGDDGVALPRYDTSVVTLAKMARISERTCQYALRELQELGELVVETHNGKTSNTYQVLLDRNHQLFDGPGAPLVEPSEAARKEQVERLSALRRSVDKAVDKPRRKAVDNPGPTKVGGVHTIAPEGCNPASKGVQTVAPNPSVRLSPSFIFPPGEDEQAVDNSGRAASDKPPAKPRQQPESIRAWFDAGLGTVLRAWARAKGYEPFLDLHLEQFRDYLAQERNWKRYSDLDAAFRTCCRDDWGGVRKNAQIAAQHGRAPDLTRWWATSDGVKAKGYALGVEREPDEPYQHFEIRVLDAAVDRDGWGAWVDPGHRVTQYRMVCQRRRARGADAPAEEGAAA